MEVQTSELFGIPSGISTPHMGIDGSLFFSVQVNSTLLPTFSIALKQAHKPITQDKLRYTDSIIPVIQGVLRYGFSH
jgi:hypothetical protein